MICPKLLRSDISKIKSTIGVEYFQENFQYAFAVRLKCGIISSKWSRNLSAPYAHEIKTTSKRANSSKFHDGADSLNKVNIWIPPGHVKVSPSNAILAAVKTTTIERRKFSLV